MKSSTILFSLVVLHCQVLDMSIEASFPVLVEKPILYSRLLSLEKYIFANLPVNWPVFSGLSSFGEL